MKIVINSCFGGFSLSPKAIAEFYKRKGRECHFFTQPDFKGKYIPVDPDSKTCISQMMLAAFDVADPDVEEDDFWQNHYLDSRPDDRTDPDLVAVVDQLGDEAGGSCAQLKVIEIPDGTNWEIAEYYGVESVHEVHASWS